MIPTKLIAKSPSWIAKGNNYYSLCVPNRQKVACAPIVPAAAMKDIEIGVRNGPKGEPGLTFKIAPNTKVAPKRIKYLIGHFLARTKKQVAHFNRMEVSYAPRPGETSLRIGATSSLVDASDGGSGGSRTCSYDDEGSYDCTGGSYGGGGEGGGGGGSGGGSGDDPIPSPVTLPDPGQCYSNCDYPPDNDNGAPDPCVDAAGNSTCPIVVIPGRRPEPGAEPEQEQVGCRPIGPMSVYCGSGPVGPLVVGDIPKLPGRAPWLPQSWCNTASIFCSEGQEPKDNDRGSNSSTSGKSMTELYELCEAIETVERDVCSANKGGMDSRSLKVCMDKATTRKIACYATARELTNKGTRLAP
ncbi:MAG: hypothetical protein V4693_10680 [Pseudomonadota bacterium]